MAEKINIEISHNVKKYRLLHNLTQEQLSQNLDIDTQYYAQLERGERNFTIEKLQKICNYFHITMNDLFPKTDFAFSEDEKNNLLVEIQKKLNDANYEQLLQINKIIQTLLS